MFAALANKVLVGLYFTYEYPSAYSLAYDFIKYYGIKDQKSKKKYICGDYS